MKTNFPTLVLVLASACATATAAFAQHPSHAHPAVHGMLVVNAGPTVYLSHLPMFHAPHDYQLIVEADLGSALASTLAADQAANPGEKLYTLIPEAFDLAAMVKSPKPFKAALFRGHFERGGKQVGSSRTVTFTKTVIFKRLDPAAKPPVHASYLLFGGTDGYFLAHLVDGKPSHDHILSVGKVTGLPSPGADRVNLSFPPVSGDKPIVPGPKIVAEHGRIPVTLENVEEIYLETGDLSF